MNKIRKGDEVIVLCGRQKGGKGVVREVFPDARGKPARVLVEGINMATHYDRPDPQNNRPGGLTKREAPIHASNVALMDDTSGRPVRAKINIAENGKTRTPSGKGAL
ncbi:MAG: 50S ribosomal protein L24 [Gammaproteobacteria bacterium]